MVLEEGAGLADSEHDGDDNSVAARSSTLAFLGRGKDRGEGRVVWECEGASFARTSSSTGGRGVDREGAPLSGKLMKRSSFLWILGTRGITGARSLFRVCVMEDSSLRCF